MKRVDVAIAIVLRESKILIALRKADGPLGRFWEFPGGKCEPSETLEQCLARELWEELAIRAKPVVALTAIPHAYPHAEVCLHPFICLHEAGEPTPFAADEVRWIEPAQLKQYRFPEANANLIAQIIDALPPHRTFRNAGRRQPSTCPA